MARPRLPQRARRSKTVEVWLHPDEVEELRLLASRRGFRRKVAGSRPPVLRGDLSKLIQDVLERAAAERENWERAKPRLLALPVAANEGGLVKTQMRVREAWLGRIRKLAEDAGLVHGGRGNVSALLRELLRLELKDAGRLDP